VKRALVFGGTGMLGRAVAAHWRRRGAAVLALSHAQADVTDGGRLTEWAARFRPQLIVNCAAAMASARLVSTVTSAANGTHSPPSAATIVAVSSAEARLRSTASTLAPSRAKRRTVARPLPIPSPGL